MFTQTAHQMLVESLQEHTFDINQERSFLFRARYLRFFGLALALIYPNADASQL